jgi:hypothetical protein
VTDKPQLSAQERERLNAIIAEGLATLIAADCQRTTLYRHLQAALDQLQAGPVEPRVTLATDTAP